MSANILSDRFIKNLNAKKLIPLAIKVLTSASEASGIQDKAKDMVQEAWKKFFNKYGNDEYKEKEVMYLMITITRNTCVEYIRRLKVEHRYLAEQSSQLNQRDEVDIALDVEYIFRSIPANYRYILEAEQNIQHETQQELVQKISDEYKHLFKVTEFNLNIFRSLKKRAKQMIEKLVKNDQV
ncbi:RNA polymerase sigma factor [Microscilla marina]|uniref:Uncharacterized protein n=1 Tax=Microscilla marina ATCC 23134 TaxID=313606 RepID=A1ZUA9_MICM2|nr:sigma-70 family RNA polymerase sigma factor [Microscilla marina]EAY26080.1 hypothetical protein M23134_06429 [Microscilla marina ATCC 23134]